MQFDHDQHKYDLLGPIELRAFSPKERESEQVSLPLSYQAKFSYFLLKGIIQGAHKPSVFFINSQPRSAIRYY